MHLTTPRLEIRPLRDEDLPALRVYLSDPIAMAAYEGPFDDAGSLAWLQHAQRRLVDDGVAPGAVVLRETGEVIGQCGITRQLIEDESVFEVGYLFQRRHWHHGYATEAASACRDWAFRTLDTDELYAKVRDTNIASMNVAIRLGMTVRRRFLVRFRNVDMPHLAFALSRREWERIAA